MIINQWYKRYIGKIKNGMQTDIPSKTKPKSNRLWHPVITRAACGQWQRSNISTKIDRLNGFTFDADAGCECGVPILRVYPCVKLEHETWNTANAPCRHPVGLSIFQKCDQNLVIFKLHAKSAVHIFTVTINKIQETCTAVYFWQRYTLKPYK